jgi:hypothetical protein
VQTAARLGIPTGSPRRQIRLSNAAIDAAYDTGGATATIAGRRCIGAVDKELARAARALADAAGTDLLVVRFSGRDAGARFIEAHHWAELGDRATGEAVFRCLRDTVH